MKIGKNVGGIDRVLRIGLGLFMMSAGIINNFLLSDEFSRWVLATFGAIFLVSGLASRCPLYALIGFKTNKIPSDNI